VPSVDEELTAVTAVLAADDKNVDNLVLAYETLKIAFSRVVLAATSENTLFTNVRDMINAALLVPSTDRIFKRRMKKFRSYFRLSADIDVVEVHHEGPSSASTVMRDIDNVIEKIKAFTESDAIYYMETYAVIDLYKITDDAAHTFMEIRHGLKALHSIRDLLDAGPIMP
jgi:hypothetical protein